MQTAAWPVVLCALAITPFLATRAARPGLGPAASLAASGLVSILLNTAVPVLLHIAAIPISAPVLGLTHLALFIVAALTLRLRGIGFMPDRSDDVVLSLSPWERVGVRVAALLGLRAKRRLNVFWVWIGGILLLIPLTPLAGIDTYKWQDLATAVSVERDIPWLMHPAALFGFGPRAYPSAQPLMLATVQTLTGCGVELGYFAVSVVAFTTALTAALCLGRGLFSPNIAVGFAALYVFAPAAVRYLHWATGRGFMLAVLPLFVLALVHMRTARGVSLLLVSALALALSHKAGLIAIALLGGGLLVAPPLGPAPRALLAVVAAAATVAATVGLGRAEISSALSAAVLAVSRFGILLAALFPAVVFRERPGSHRSVAKAVTLMLVLFPIALTPDMYGALVVLPLVAIACASGLDTVLDRRLIPRPALAWTIGLFLAAGAVSVVVARDMRATPRRVREAARYLDALDPSGPLQVHAPRHRGRIQAYLRGCPRFNVSRVRQDAEPRPAVPSLRGPLVETVRGVTAWLRNLAEPAGFTTDWYGANPRQYYVTLDGEGEQPPGARLVYDKDGVRIFALGALPDGP